MAVQTFLFTDVEGSTRLWETHPDLMPEVMARHDELVEGIVTGAGGTLVTSRAEGDSAFAVFDGDDGALRASAAAIALHRAMASEGWPGELVVRTRAAIHSGEADTKVGSYYGPVVNRCVRLRAVAHGSQTVLSRASAEACGDALGSFAGTEGAWLVDLGEHRLKDLATPERIAQLNHPALPIDFPPLRSVDQSRHNLAPLVQVPIGRDEDRNWVAKLIGDGGIVTVTGPAGVGKTTLALDAAWAQVGQRAGGVWWVPVGAASTPEDVAVTLLDALGLREQPGRRLIDSLVEGLTAPSSTSTVGADESAALAAVASVATDVVGRRRDVVIVLTSQGTLGVPGEQVWRLSGLAVDDAVDLLVSRVGDSVDRSALAAVCERADGLPLALHVVAPLILEHGVDAALAQLEQGGLAPLAAAIEWSHGLLEHRDKVLLRRLAAFAGGFSIEAAEGACADEALDELDVLDGLAALVDRSLIASRGTGDGRFTMGTSVRAFARQRLDAAAEVEAQQRRHLGWFGDLAAQAYAEMTAGHIAEAFDRLTPDHDNLRSALEFDGAQEDADAQVLLAIQLVSYWDARGHWLEAIGSLVRCLQRTTTYRSYRIFAFQSLGYFAELRADWALAQQSFDRALALSEELVAEVRSNAEPELDHHLDQQIQIHTRLVNLAIIQGKYGDAHARVATLRASGVDRESQLADVEFQLAMAEGRPTAARTASQRGVEAARAVGNDRVLVSWLTNLANAEQVLCQLSDALAHYNEALTIARQVRDDRLIARALHNIADLSLLQGKYDALDSVHEVAAMQRRLGSRSDDAAATLLAAAFHAAMGEPDDARRLASRALTTFETLGDVRTIIQTEQLLAEVALLEGNYDEARERVERAVDLAPAGPRRGWLHLQGAEVRVALDDVDVAGGLIRQALPHVRNAESPFVAISLSGAIANVESARGKHDSAMRLLGWGLKRREELGLVLTALGQWRSRRVSQAARGNADIETALDRGRSAALGDLFPAWAVG